MASGKRGAATGRHTILIVTPDQAFAGSLAKRLGEYGYQAVTTDDLAGALAEARRNTPSLVIAEHSPSLVRNLRAERSLRNTPVITVYPQGTDCTVDCVGDVEEGVDLTLCRPFSSAELVARIRAILRREALSSSPTMVYQVGDLRVDLLRHEVTVRGRPIELTLKEFQILEQLVQHPGRVFRRDELLNLVWGEGAALEEHNLDVHIHSIRRKLETDPAHPQLIATIRGIGYKLRSDS